MRERDFTKRRHYMQVPVRTQLPSARCWMAQYVSNLLHPKGRRGRKYWRACETTTGKIEG